MKNKELARMFNRLADVLEYKGENIFRVLAYRKAARVIEELVEDVAVLNAEGRLEKLSGIGQGIAQKIDEYLRTGRMKKYEETTADVPESLIELLNIQNMGPRTLALAHEKLGVKDLIDLKRVLGDGSLARLPQMGEKKVENIKKNLELFERSQTRISIAVGEGISTKIIDYLKTRAPIDAVSPAGSLRRWKETIGDIDILVTGKDNRKIIGVFIKFPDVKRVLAAGDTKASILVEDGIQVDIRIVKQKSFGAALQYFTGSKEHNVRLRDIAKSKKWKLNEYGVFKGEKSIAGKTEEDVYKILGLQWIPPEIREDRGEVELARQKALPTLVELADIKGDLHVHSSYSDSSADIKELVSFSQRLGYEYILIADHSRSAKYAGGLDIEEIYRQWEEIDKINKKLTRCKVLKGTEVDILKDGKLDYPDKILKGFDLVVASVHQGFTKNVTERTCDAMENPYVDIIGHPTGRLISSREGYKIDINKILTRAARTSTWLECNSYPDRLDLNEVNLRKARDMNVKISIGTDAHGARELLWLKFGVAQARRGWLAKGDVVNTRSIEEILALQKRRRG